MKKNFQTYVYDLDGTIIDTMNVHALAWEEVCKEQKIPFTKEMEIASRGVKEIDVAKNIVLPNYLLDKSEEIAQQKIRKFIELSDKVELFDGALETLYELKERGRKLAINSSASKEAIEKTLEHILQLEEIFGKNIIYADHVERGKPYPDSLKLTRKILNAQKNEMVYIGDASSDYRAAKNYGINFIYFCPNSDERDEQIPKEIWTIKNHKEILEAIK